MSAPWLIRHLEATGRWNADGVSRKGRVRKHTCGAIVVVALDGDRCALPVIADGQPLSPLGEALAVLAGRTTYAATLGAGHLRLDRRSDLHIAGAPAGSQRRTDVVAEHRCGDVPLPAIDSQLATIVAATDYADPPPF